MAFYSFTVLLTDIFWPGKKVHCESLPKTQFETVLAVLSHFYTIYYYMSAFFRMGTFLIDKEPVNDLGKNNSSFSLV